MEKVKNEIKNVFKKGDNKQNATNVDHSKDSAPQISRSEPSEVHDASLNQIHKVEEKERQERMHTDQEQAKENANKLANMVDQNVPTQQ
jgi:hypothetical protein